jgi:hypothetical protein
MQIYDCDEFTRVWYQQNFGYSAEEMSPLEAPRTAGRRTVSVAIPPPSLIGSDEDTIRNVLSLHPKPAPKDEMKLIERMHDVLRFKGRMVTNNAVDASREFIITFYLSDDTVQIYEPPQRNSGIVAGKFLQRTKLKNPETGDYFRASDLEVGAVVTINKNAFRLLQATEYAMSYMEADPETFRQSDLAGILEKLRAGIKESGKAPKELFTQYSDHGKMDIGALMGLFQGLGCPISAHEALTVLRRYQMDSDTQAVTLREFLAFAQ